MYGERAMVSSNCNLACCIGLVPVNRDLQLSRYCRAVQTAGKYKHPPAAVANDRPLDACLVPHHTVLTNNAGRTNLYEKDGRAARGHRDDFQCLRKLFYQLN